MISQQTIKNGWSEAVLGMQIETRLYGLKAHQVSRYRFSQHRQQDPE